MRNRKIVAGYVIVICLMAALNPASIARADSDRKGTVTGHVRDQAGRQLKNARVTIISKSRSGAAGARPRAEIRDQGYGDFECPNLAPGLYTLEARHPDYPKTAMADIVIFPDDYSPSVDLYMGVENIVGGKVVENLSGREEGVAGVNVKIMGSREAKTPDGTPYPESVNINTVTGVDGTFRISVPPRRHERLPRK